MEILITGDFCPINRAEKALLNNQVLDDKIQNIFNKVDLNITNLECPLTESNKSIKKSGPSLKAKPSMGAILKKFNINLVTLANNHILDYGSEGLLDTIKILNTHQINYVGAGKAIEKNNTFYFVKDNLKIAVINVCENEWSTIPINGYNAIGFSEIDLFYIIKNAKQVADYVLVIHHGGFEMYNLPSPRLKKALRYLIDCGADVVINHHTHCISISEIYNNKHIYYSLGNFVFDNPAYRDNIWNYGLMVKLKITPDGIDTQDFYFKQFGEKEEVQLVEKENLPFQLDNLYQVFRNKDKFKQSFDDFLNQKTRMYKNFLEPTKLKYYNALVLRNGLPSLWNKTKKLTLGNLIRCESHREALIEILNNENSHTQQ